MNKEGPFDSASWWETADGPFVSTSEFEGGTIDEARAWMLPRFKAGLTSNCPCCGQNVKLYARTITSGMFAAMVRIAREGPLLPRDVLSGIGGGGGDYSKLRFWGLVKQGADKRWSATQNGLLFLSDRLSVPKWMLVYDDVVLGCSIRQMDVHEAAGERFSFGALMAPETVRDATAV